MHSSPKIPAEFNRCHFSSWCRILGICGSAHPPGAWGCACPGTHRPAPLSCLGPTASFRACWPLKAKYKINKFEKRKEGEGRERGNQPGCAPAPSQAIFNPHTSSTALQGCVILWHCLVLCSPFSVLGESCWAPVPFENNSNKGGFKGKDAVPLQCACLGSLMSYFYYKYNWISNSYT